MTNDWWHGYDRQEFEVSGRSCVLVQPRTAAPHRPWIWRTEFLGHEPQADAALLGHGFHVGYINVQDLYGAPVALSYMDHFYDAMLAQHQLSPRVVLEGFSRGGLFALNWATRHPERVSCIYVDAPVCDFKSWPGGKGCGPGSPADWGKLLTAYDLTEDQALRYEKNPVDNLKPLADAGIAILSVCGLADEVVPFCENTEVLARRYQALGGRITVITKPTCGHHPHSLADPQPIVDFVISHDRG